MAEIEKVQPSGDQTSVGERSSARRGYAPIASGWSPIRIVPKTDGVLLTLKSTSEHINWQRLGTDKKNYPIPGLPTGVSFWWGAPLPWAPNRIPKIVARAPGMFWFSQITHPGIEAYGGSDFVRRAWGMVQQPAKNQFSETADRILFQPFREMR